MARTIEELESQRREREAVTDRELKESEAITEDAVHAVESWSGQVEPPALVETIQALQAIADDLERNIASTHENQADTVEGSIATEEAETSNPARESEAKERAEAEKLQSDAAGQERFGEHLGRGAEAREEGGDALGEVAEGSETHQENGEAERERHIHNLEAILQRIDHFDG
jgi:hypothetical protein